MCVLSYVFSKIKVIIKKSYVIVTNKINILYYDSVLIIIILIMSSAPTAPTMSDGNDYDRLRKRHKVSFSIYNEDEETTSSSPSNKDHALFRFFFSKEKKTKQTVTGDDTIQRSCCTMTSSNIVSWSSALFSEVVLHKTS